jgi:outer membrane protein OmpA-like peptidoglycan-associated protein
VLAKYVPGRSAILGAQIHKDNFSFGVSYDFPALASNSGNLGALEVGLEVRRLVNPKYKPKKNSQKKSTKSKSNKNPIDKKMAVVKIQLKKIEPLQKPPQQEKKIIDTAIVVKKEEDKQMEITVAGNKVDTSYVTLNAKAGKLRQEPYAFEKITLQFQFAFNSVDLDDETETFLNDLGKSLSEDKNLKVKIVGHTDNIGSVKFNEKLSLKRAESVKEFLLKNRVDLSRIITEGKGMSEPVVENDTEENRSKNRRVEILLFRE